MADYPTLPQYTGSSEKNVDPLIISRSRSGAVKARMLQGSVKREFKVMHVRLTAAEKSTLDTFLFVTKRGIPFTFAWNHEPGTVYTVVLAAPNGLEWVSVGPYWSVTVPLAEA